VEQWWNEKKKKKTKYSEKITSQCHFVCQKSNTDWSGNEPGGLSATDRQNHLSMAQLMEFTEKMKKERLAYCAIPLH
jgi:hypothetical protein